MQPKSKQTSKQASKPLEMSDLSQPGTRPLTEVECPGHRVAVLLRVCAPLSRGQRSTSAVGQVHVARAAEVLAQALPHPVFPAAWNHPAATHTLAVWLCLAGADQMRRAF